MEEVGSHVSSKSMDTTNVKTQAHEVLSLCTFFESMVVLKKNEMATNSSLTSLRNCVFPRFY